MFLVPLTTSYHPVHRSLALSRSLDRFFSAPRVDDAPLSPSLDVSETDAAYAVTMDLPGVDKSNVDIDIEGRRVSVKARTDRKTDGDSASEVDAKTSDRLLYSERVAAHYARSFTLPAEVDATQADAKLENGVLTLTLPKRVAKVASRITVR